MCVCVYLYMCTRKGIYRCLAISSGSSSGSIGSSSGQSRAEEKSRLVLAVLLLWF